MRFILLAIMLSVCGVADAAIKRIEALPLPDHMAELLYSDAIDCDCWVSAQDDEQE